MSAPPTRPRRTQTSFRPNFLLIVFYVGAFTLLFGLLIALPDLVEGARSLGPGPDELTPEELARAEEISRQALGGGRILLAFVAAGAAVAAGIWTKRLPGFRR